MRAPGGFIAIGYDLEPIWRWGWVGGETPLHSTFAAALEAGAEFAESLAS